MNMLIRARAWWHALSARDRDWALNVCWGVLIEALVLIGHIGGYSWMDAVTNAPFEDGEIFHKRSCWLKMMCWTFSFRGDTGPVFCNGVALTRWIF